MGVTVKVNGQSNSLAHKGSNGFAKSTAPDVCKTPTPGGPVPIPYPIIFSFSSDLKDGTKTVKADGGNMIAVKGSEFSRCTGDEPGTAGGVVSSTNMKEAKWILYSFDVKMEGQNACRLSDKMTMNHGNTVCLQGEMQAAIIAATKALQDIACKCDKLVNESKSKQKKIEKKKNCRDLGSQKHDCCEKAIKKHNREGKSPQLQSETGYKDGKRIGPPPSRKKAPGESKADYYARISDTVWPDMCLMVDGKPAKIFDFKFACPEGVRKADTKPSIPDWTPGNMKKGKPGQLAKYQKLSSQLGINIFSEEQQPEIIHNMNCS